METKHLIENSGVSSSSNSPAALLSFPVSSSFHTKSYSPGRLLSLLIRLFSLLSLLFWGTNQTLFAQADQNNFNSSGNIPSTTVANLPGGVGVGTLRQVTDAASQGNCTTGGGAAVALCRWNGSAWIPIGDGGNGNLTPATTIPCCATAEYRMYASEVSTTTLADSSGNGNNGTFPGSTHNPTRLSNGGLSFASASQQSITLPSALNSCQSFIFEEEMNNASNFPNGAAALLEESSIVANTVFFLGFQNSFNAGAYGDQGLNKWSRVSQITANSGTPGSTNGISSGQGSHTVAYTGGSGVSDRLYMDGIETPMYLLNTQTSSNVYNPGSSVWQLGGASTNNGWFNGNIRYFACWPRVLAPWEIAQAHAVIAQVMQQRGLTFPSNSSSSGTTSAPTNNIVAIDGDSINWGQYDNINGVPSWVMNMTLTTSATIYSIAQGGALMLTQLLPNGPYADNYYPANGAAGTYGQGGGRNDLCVQNYTVPQVEGSIANDLKARQLKGWKTIAFDLVSISAAPSNCTAANKNAYATWMRQNWWQFANAFVDYTGDGNFGLGCDACAGTNFPDSTHPNLYQTQFQTYYTQRAVNRLNGPQDFTTATTYSSAAAAATTVTAASDSAVIGLSTYSTATYTFTSNPFSVGQLVTCTGITPAGYNQVFLVNSANATQITGIINTSGLGAGTVFGSCSAPQIEDAIFLLNFGAGNATLGTACAYTTQLIKAKNINTGTSTLVPFGSETIDGAANLSIAQNQVRILQSIISTPSTPVCGWKVIQ